MRLSALILSFLFCALLWSASLCPIVSPVRSAADVALALDNDPPAQPDPDQSGRG